MAGIFIVGNAFALSVETLGNQLPGFFPEEVKQEWLQKQEEGQNARRERLRQIQLQRLQREEEKKKIDPEAVLREAEEREAYQNWLVEQEEFQKQKELKQQQKALEKQAEQSIEEINSALEQLDALEKEIRTKMEADLEQIQTRRMFLSEKLTELEAGDYSTGVKITNTEDAIDLGNRFLENMMISPTETSKGYNAQPEEDLSSTSYREQMKVYYRQKDLGVENGKLSARQKIGQMRSLKSRADYNQANLTRAQKVQRALQSRSQRTTSQPERMSEAVLRALKNRRD